jgi:hypothetical protein
MRRVVHHATKSIYRGVLIFRRPVRRTPKTSSEVGRTLRMDRSGEPCKEAVSDPLLRNP